eukprot:c5346_g1_i1.p1 GENE.c5346_g1_i1~~c5346_g1_i1.p1  ORF type:complete len:575 (+),score=135.96 c5346_g1_i1:682-2406(+)
MCVCICMFGLPISCQSVGFNMVMCCAMSGYAEIIKYLLVTYPAPPVTVDMLKIPVGAMYHDKLDVSSFLTRGDGQPATPSDLPMTHTLNSNVAHIAAWLGHVNVLEKLVELPGFSKLLSEPSVDGAFPFDLAINQLGNDDAVTFLAQHCAAGSLYSELVCKHKPFRLSMSKLNVAIPARNRMDSMCRFVPSAASHIMDSTAWLYFQRRQYDSKLISIIPFVSDQETLRRMLDDEDGLNEQSITPEHLADIDPACTIWGKYVFNMWWNGKGEEFSKCAVAQKILSLKWKNKVFQATKLECGFETLFAAGCTWFAYSPTDSVITYILASLLLAQSCIRIWGEVTEMRMPFALQLYFSVFWNYLDIFVYTFVPAMVATKLANNPSQNHLAAAVVVACYVKLLQFLALSVMFTNLIRMIGKMMIDVIKFFALLSFFITGFSLALHITFMNNPNAPECFSSFGRALVSCYRITLGDLLFDEVTTSDDGMAFALWLCYTVVVALLLLNMLIAMMATTFDFLSGRAVGEMLCARACSVIHVERSLRKSARIEMWDSIFAESTSGAGGTWAMTIGSSGVLVE